jgi:predicted nucleotidyltransferase
MPTAKDANLERLKLVAIRLGPLLERVVFVGGCVTGLLITDEAVEDVRPTDDVDFIVEVASKAEYAKLEKELRKLGFRQDPFEAGNICRWQIENVLIDVMPTDASILNFGNQWYGPAIENAQTLDLAPELACQVITSPYFIATKMEAFLNRGQSDYLTSHDMEDIITVIDGRPELVDEIRASSKELRSYLAEKFGFELDEGELEDALPGYLNTDVSSQARIQFILPRIKEIAGMED